MTTELSLFDGLAPSLDAFAAASKLLLLRNQLNLVRTIHLLSSYEEEGVPLFPRVFFTDDLTEMKKMLPSSTFLRIGLSSKDSVGIGFALKKTAPLATGGWDIYLHENQDGVDFGLFNTKVSPATIQAEDILLDKDLPFAVTLASKRSIGCVEIHSNAGDMVRVLLTPNTDGSFGATHTQMLIRSIIELVERQFADRLETFLGRLFDETLKTTHGCLIAVAKNDAPPSILASDGTNLDQPIDLCDLFQELSEGRISEREFENRALLLKGMLSCDGIVLFSRRGCILGFNYFIKLKKAANKAGGARRRAYDALEKRVGRELTAAFMLSQDGWTHFKGKNNV